MAARRVDVFFYGLFMDAQPLLGKGVRPSDIRPALVRGFALRIGGRAALVPTPAGQVHGRLIKLTHEEIDRLYSEPSVQTYKPEAMLAVVSGNDTVAALCYNLPEAPAPTERNPEYAAKLRSLAQRVGLPDHYIASIQ